MRLYPHRLLQGLLNMNGNQNPGTGDPNAGLLWIVIAALVLSAALIIVLVVIGKKGGKK